MENKKNTYLDNLIIVEINGINVQWMEWIKRWGKWMNEWMNEWMAYLFQISSKMAQFWLQFINIFPLIYFTKLLIASGKNHQKCILENQQQEKKEGDFWIHQNFFNVTCLNGKIEAKNIEKENIIELLKLRWWIV